MARAQLGTAVVVAATLLGAATAGWAADPLSGQQPPDQWRASKLIGVPVYGPTNKVVGHISDVLMSHDGRANAVVVGVGGFLGLGQKDVAIPFGQVRFVDEPAVPPADSTADAGTMGSAPVAPVGTPATASPGGGVPSAAALGTSADTLGTPTAPAMAGATGTAPAAAGTMQRSTSYPDHGVIDMTADQLKGAPAFHYAP